jgi:hypothetical protein
MKATPKKRVPTMKLERIVATKFNKPKTIQSKKVSNLEDAYLGQGKASVDRYRKTGNSSDLSKALSAGKSAAMLNKDVVKKTMLSKMKKKMK